MASFDPANRVTQEEIEALASIIPCNTMEKLAPKHLNMSAISLDNITVRSRGNMWQFNRSVLTEWIRQHPNSRQVGL